MPDCKFRIGNYFLEKRRGSANWCACWYDASTRQTCRSSLRTDDFQEAQIRLARFVTEHQEIRYARPEDTPLETILVRYWHQHGKRLPSADQARIALALWSDLLPGIAVSELTPARQEAFVAALRARGHKGSYISRVLSVGRAALNRAWKRQEITAAPFVMDVDRHDASQKPILTIDETARLLEAAAAYPHVLAFCMISLNTLARPDAVFDLSPFQVDINRRRIDLNPSGRRQTKKYRPVVPITDTLLPWVSRRDVERFVLFQGRPIESIKGAWRIIREAAELPKSVTPYALRHTMATELRARGVPEWEAMGIMGHKSPSARTTEVYAKFRPDYLGEAVRAIDAYFAEMRPKFGDRNLTPSATAVRAVPVLGRKTENLQALDSMVGATGIEPVTPTMST